VSQRIRSKLSFANVMSVIAVFAVIGGTAFAAKKLNGKQLKVASVGAKKLACPKQAPSRDRALCYSAAQAPTGWINASQVVCKNLGLRLPTNGEALVLLTKTGGVTWADDVIVEGPGGAATRVENGTVVFSPIAQNHPFRCVTVVG
jgi:hypothetical protein